MCAYEYISELLKPEVYIPIIGSLGMWKHKKRRIFSNLVVDDFGAKYFDKQQGVYCMCTVQNYKTTVEWDGTNFIGVTLNYHYD